MPIRLRLTGAFALVMAILLATIGALLYLRTENALTEALDDGLRARLNDLAENVGHGRVDYRHPPPDDRGLEGAQQILTPNGQVRYANPALTGAPLLTAPQRARLTTAAMTLDVPDAAGTGTSIRLRATRVNAPDGPLLAVVATPDHERSETLAELRTALLAGGPIALLLASLAGYGLATAALRPVESMRRTAAAITPEQTAERLPVSQIGDEISRLGHTLNDMLKRLERGFERERAFVADASHELRTPVTMLKAELDLALQRDRTPAEYRAALESAAEEAAHLKRLAENLLLITRADQGRLLLHAEPLDVTDLLDTLQRRYARPAAAAHRQLTLHTPPNLPPLRGDRTRLEQALANLIDNALRHGTGTIHLAAHHHDATIELHVRDQGPGFPNTFLAHAFERFTRADNSRTTPGTGLGLAIVAAIAEAHGGHAHARNHPDHGGADTWLTLPTSA